jgi:hypothetical protein
VGHDAEYIASYLNQVDSDVRLLRERTEFDDEDLIIYAAGRRRAAPVARITRIR